jgi:hypothetical protein
MKEFEREREMERGEMERDRDRDLPVQEDSLITPDHYPVLSATTRATLVFGEMVQDTSSVTSRRMGGLSIMRQGREAR